MISCMVDSIVKVLFGLLLIVWGVAKILARILDHIFRIFDDQWG